MISEEYNRLLNVPNLPALIEQVLQFPISRRVPELKKAYPNLSTAILAEWATNVEKAVTKLPTFAHHRCLMPTLSLEQASPEIVANILSYSNGEIAVDLTGGLGVDSYFMARKFQQVIYIETDAMLCRLAEYNFKRLGIDNITILNTTAEKWLAENETEVDLIYADPSRRNERQARISDPDQCFPSVATILPMVERTTGRFLLKTSPLFDFREGLRRWKMVRKVHFYSVNDEMKEIIYDFQFNNSADQRRLLLNAFVKHQWFQYDYPYF